MRSCRYPRRRIGANRKSPGTCRRPTRAPEMAADQAESKRSPTNPGMRPGRQRRRLFRLLIAAASLSSDSGGDVGSNVWSAESVVGIGRCIVGLPVGAEERIDSFDHVRERGVEGVDQPSLVHGLPAVRGGGRVLNLLWRTGRSYRPALLSFRHRSRTPRAVHRPFVKSRRSAPKSPP